MLIHISWPVLSSFNSVGTLVPYAFMLGWASSYVWTWLDSSEEAFRAGYSLVKPNQLTSKLLLRLNPVVSKDCLVYNLNTRLILNIIKIVIRSLEF